MITKVINVNLHQPIYEKLTAKQGDIASRYLLFHLLDGDKPFDLSNKTVRVYAIKPDKTEIFNDLTINDASKGYCTLELTSQCLASAGVVKMELYISESGKVLTSIPFELEVIACINTANSVTSTNEFSALEVALGSLQDYDNLRREIAQARKGHVVVGERLDNFDSQLEQINKHCYVARERYTIEINDNNIIDEAINNDKTNVLFFPKREYEVSKTFYPKQGQKLFFNNCNMINKIENSVPIFQILESDVEIHDLFNINTINNNKIDNNTTQSLYGSTIAIGDPYNKELIKNVKIINCASINSIGGVSAFICVGNVENIKFIDCYVNGTQIKSGEGFISGFHAEWMGTDVLSCKNVTMENCIVENFSSHDSYAFYISSVIQCTLKNCKAKNVNMGYILYDGDRGTEGDGVDNILVENCLVENYSAYGYSIKSKNDTDYDKIRVSIINSTAKNCTNDTGCSFRIYRNKGGIRLRDNKIIGCYNAIIGDPTNGLIMEGNEFKNVRNRNISFIQLECSTISKNNFCSENMNGEDIYLEFLSNNNDISDNDFIGTGSKFNIYLKSDANLSNNNKIHGNNFNATYGLVNGATTDLTKGLRTYVYNNVNKQDNPIYAGASVYVNEGSKTKLYHTAPYEFPNSKIGDEVINISPSVGQPMGWIKTAVGVMTPYNILS